MRKYVTLGDVCKKGSSNIAQKDIENSNGTYAIYGASGYIKDVNFYHQDKPYIAVVKDGAGIGRTMLLPEKTSVIGTLQYLIPNDSISVKYLYYAVTYMNLSKYFTGATIPHIYFKDYQKELLPLPPMEKQLEIARNLEKIDAMIELCNSIVEKMDVLVKSRFVEMFDNNNDWDTVNIEDICSDMRTGPFGSALHHDEFVDNGIFVLGIDNAVENKFSYNRMRYITEEKYQKLKRYTVKPLDVIITIMGTVGRSAVIPKDIPLAINTKHLACLTLKNELADPYFLANAFQIHPEIIAQMHMNSKGAIMDGLNLTIIKHLRFKLPPLDLQQSFAAFVHEIDKSKFATQKALTETQQLFDSLMQKYFG